MNCYKRAQLIIHHSRPVNSRLFEVNCATARIHTKKPKVAPGEPKMFLFSCFAYLFNNFLFFEDLTPHPDSLSKRASLHVIIIIEMRCFSCCAQIFEKSLPYFIYLFFLIFTSNVFLLFLSCLDSKCFVYYIDDAGFFFQKSVFLGFLC